MYASQGKGGPFTQLKLGVLPDNYVTLESVSNPGNYVNMSSQGVANAPNTIMPTSPDAQFFVRLNRQCYTPRTTLMTPFGTPSLINKVHNDMIVQLEAFHTGVFLAVMPNGSVTMSSNPMDPNSKCLCVLEVIVGLIHTVLGLRENTCFLCCTGKKSVSISFQISSD